MMRRLLRLPSSPLRLLLSLALASLLIALLPAAGQAASLAVGEHHACAVTVARTVACWGTNDDGQLGTGDRLPRASATEVPGLTGAIAVAARYNTTCALVGGGQLRCWGSPTGGLFAAFGARENRDAAHPKPRTIAGVTDGVDLALSDLEVCVLRTGGRLSCMAQRPKRHRELVLRTMKGRGRVLEIAAGERHMCARSTGGAVRCWGDRPEAGSDETYDDYRRAPIVRVRALDHVTSLGLSKLTTCGAFRDGTVRCARHKATQPAKRVPGIAGVARLSSGELICATRAAGTVKCLAYDGRSGVLGGWPPKDTPGLTDATYAVMAPGFACAERGPSQIACWGDDIAALGSGQSLWASTPMTVPALSDISAISSGSKRTCALRADRRVSCWGQAASGVIDAVDESSPVEIPGIENAASLSSSSQISCAVGFAGDVRCWGTIFREYRPSGLLATVAPGTIMSSAPGCLRSPDSTVRCLRPYFDSPTQLEAPKWLQGSLAVATDEDDVTCAIAADRTVTCSVEKEGDPGVSMGVVKTHVPGFTDVTAIETDYYGVCALHGNGTVSCWGDIDLGDGKGQRELTTAQPVPGITGASAIALRGNGLCAIVDGGKVRCNFDVAAAPSAEQRNASGPHDLPGVTDAIGLTLDGAGGCVLRADHTVACWGSGANGRLGDGPVPTGHGPQPVPQPVAGLPAEGAAAIAH